LPFADESWRDRERGKELTIEGTRKVPTRSLAQQRRLKRSESMISELETIALALFEKRGFAAVTVEEIAAAAEISPRTFYRYFRTKEDVLLIKVRRRAEALKSALAKRPSDEPPLHSVRMAIESAVAAEDPSYVRRWVAVVASAPSALRAAYGGCIVLIDAIIADFFASRLALPADALQPAMLAAAVGGIIQAAQNRWLFRGGNLVRALSEGLGVLEEAMGTGVASIASTRTSRKPPGRSNRFNTRDPR
jgi:TetR/AcrR family transcriptional regulator, regulator of mycofactocin system